MAAVLSTHEEQYPHGFQLVIIVFTVILASMLELLDTTIVNVALREISGSIGATTTEIAWVVTAYAISNVIIIPLSGMLSNLFGRKIYFTASIAIFTISSLMCGLSGSLGALVFWRFIQGLGGGALMATSQTVLVEVFPPKKLVVGMAIFGAGLAMGPALGPLLGGYLTDILSWHWIFFINVPLGLLVTSLSWFFVSNEKNRIKAGKFDWTGIILLALGVGSLQFVLEEGNTYDWFASGEIKVFMAIAVIGIISFVIWELKAKYPATDLRVLKKSNVAVGALFNFVIGAVLLSVLYSYPLFTQISLGWTPTLTGLGLTPGALMTGVGIAFVQALFRKGFNPKIIILIGFLITSTFCFWMSFQSPDSNWDSMFLPLVLRGLGLSFLMVPVITLAIEGLKGYDLAQGTGICNMTRQLGSAFGLALVSNRITHANAMFRNDLVSDINNIDVVPTTAIQNMTQTFIGNGYPTHEAQSMAYKIMDLSVFKQTAILGYLDSFYIVGVACIVILPLLFLMKHNKSVKSDPSAGVH
jgi:DHA2 family multidrug resistance protein